MANSLSAGIKEVWDKRYQVTHYKIPVYPAVANLAVSAQLKVGDTLHREYINEKMAYDVGSQGSYTRQDANDSDETLSIDEEKESTVYVKDLDKLQNHLPIQDKHAKSASKAIFEQIDAEVLGEATNFSNTLDDGDLGGTDGNGISVTATNVVKLFTGSNLKMQRNNINIQNLTARFTGKRQEDAMNRYGIAVIGPYVYQKLLERAEGKESVFGDKVAKSGHKGNYMGFELFVSNNLPGTVVLDMATNPSDGDTITINGTTLTFKTTLGTTAGNVHIASDVDKTRANLVNALENPTTDISSGTDVGFASFTKGSTGHDNLNNINATNNNSADTLTLYQKGVGYFTVSSSLTASGDGWQTSTEVQHCLFGVSNAIDTAVQKKPKTQVKDRTGYIGNDIVTWSAYGTKVFNESLNRMIDVQVLTSGF